LTRFLDSLAQAEELPKTIIYTLNPRDIDPVCALAGCFQGGSFPGRVQPGPAWWFNDTREGMEEQLTSLARIGLLSRFTGMVTDSRSFLSFSRHEYFRRILANLVGGRMDRGEFPRDFDLLGGIIKDICYTNAQRFFAPFH
jgi:glucuronate isomerase